MCGLWRRTSRRDDGLVGLGGAHRDLHDMPGQRGPIAYARSGIAPTGRSWGELGARYERRKRNREQRTQEAHPRIGGLLLALRSAPQHESAFHQGAVAERAVADSMAMRTDSDRVITLHNRRMPSGRGDIDHLAIAPTGVWVIDTKDWKGKVAISSPWFGKPRLLIRGRDCTKLIDGLERQTAAVRAARRQRLWRDRGSRRSLLHKGRPPILEDPSLSRPPASVPQGARPAAQRRRSSFFSEHRAARATPGNTSSSGTLNATRQKRVPLRQYRRRPTAGFSSLEASFWRHVAVTSKWFASRGVTRSGRGATGLLCVGFMGWRAPHRLDDARGHAEGPRPSRDCHPGCRARGLYSDQHTFPPLTGPARRARVTASHTCGSEPY